MVLESQYTEKASSSDSSLNYLDGSDQGLYYLYSSFGELVLEVAAAVVVIVVVAVGTEMLVGVVLLPHMDMDNTVEEPWELDTSEHQLSLCLSLLIFSW